MKEYIVPVSDKGNMNMIENELHLQQLIRCKDCEYGIIHENEVECKAHDEIGYDPEPWHPIDWFCADGERKET